jgi:hypothetical protein
LREATTLALIAQSEKERIMPRIVPPGEVGGSGRILSLSGLSGEVPGDLFEQGGAGDHLLAITPPSTDDVVIEARIRGIERNAVALLEFSLTGTLLSGAEFDLERKDGRCLGDVAADCWADGDDLVVEVKLPARKRLRYVVMAVLREGELEYVGAPDRGVAIRELMINGRALTWEGLQPAAPAVTAVTERSDEIDSGMLNAAEFVAIAQWSDLALGEQGNVYTWPSVERAIGKIIARRDGSRIELRIECIGDAEHNIRALMMIDGFVSPHLAASEISRQLVQDLPTITRGDMRQVVTNVNLRLTELLAPVFAGE